MVLAAERMRHTDAFLWYMEDDPLLRSTILAITLLEGTPDWEYLRARMDRASRALPMFRQRVQPPPLRLGPPWRTPAPDFDLDYHLRRIRAPQPADWRGVLDFAQTSLMAAFDRDRPLWEFTLIEGLDGGRSAFVTKLHHCLADGIAGVQIAALVVDADASMPAIEPLGPLLPVGLRKAGDLLAASVADNAEQAARLAVRAAGRGPRDPARAAPPPHRGYRCLGYRDIRGTDGATRHRYAVADPDRTQHGPPVRDRRGADDRRSPGHRPA